LIPKLLAPIYWVGLSILILAGDYLIGPYVQFPILFVVPVLLASLYSGFAWGFSLSLCMPLLRLFYATLVWSEPVLPVYAGINALIRACVLSLLAFLVSHAAKKAREVKVLSGLLPICSFCKRIRSSDNSWVPIETCVTDRTNSKFTHSFCPDCVEERYGINLRTP